MNNQKGGFALGLIVGLLLGLTAALAVALYFTNMPVPLINKGQQRTPEQDAAEAARNKNWDPNAALTGKPTTRPPAEAQGETPPPSDTAVVPRKPGPAIPTAADNGRVTPASRAAQTDASRSNRDAAAILAGGDTPDAKPAADAKPANVAAAGADPFIYFVQVGAFSNPDDAEQLRAKLALSGFRATVTEREQGGHTVHRVRLGPFDKKDDADAQQDRVKAIVSETSLVRLERSKQ
jgi:cell division protein FtsN